MDEGGEETRVCVCVCVETEEHMKDVRMLKLLYCIRMQQNLHVFQTPGKPDPCQTLTSANHSAITRLIDVFFSSPQRSPAVLRGQNLE